MPSLLSRYQQDGYLRPQLALPVTLFLSAFLSLRLAYSKHALLTTFFAWSSLCILCSLRLSFTNILDASSAQRLAWAAGLVIVLAQVQEKAVEGSGIWWAKALIPLIVFTGGQSSIFRADTIANGNNSPPSPTKESTASQPSRGIIIILTTTAVAATYVASRSSTAVSLGIGYSALYSGGLLLAERAGVEAEQQSQKSGNIIYSAHGLLSQPDSPAEPTAELVTTVLRDISAAAAVCSGAAVVVVEGFTLEWLYRATPAAGLPGRHGDFTMVLLGLLGGLLAVSIKSVVNASALILVHRRDSFDVSLVSLYVVLCAQVIYDFSLTRLWFAALCLAATALYLGERFNVTSGSRMQLRAGKILTLLTLASFTVAGLLYSRWQLSGPASHSFALPSSSALGQAPTTPLQPLQYTNAQVHPVDQLTREAEVSWLQTVNRQSPTLDAAVAEYRRRYTIPPPPNFDKWYEFATERGVKLIDEYDTIHHSLMPFWALPPVTVRSRVREALGFGPNNLMGVLVRDGQVYHIDGGQEWLQQAISGMMKPFVRHLPDMDLAFNIHDEPRVVVPHDELSRLVDIATRERLPSAASNVSPRNSFSVRPADVKRSKRIEEVKRTRFNVFAHQPTWIPSRLSCAPDSPARSLDDSEVFDNLTSYAYSDLGFVYNHTAFSDVCNSPSFSSSHGFFDRPNAFNVIHELFPIFSQSKMSSFQDILYPSPWYWFGKVDYDESKDFDWKSKINSLWWRGSTTGGFSRDGGWRRQHRQHLVQKINAPDVAKVLGNSNKDNAGSPPNWQVKDVKREDFKQVMDVHFSGVGQCDPGDCDAQREFFDVAPPADQQDAWKYRYLLDMDGNAFSGRFYAFLKSNSLTFKMAVFREWHEEWIKPWVHYIPLSLRGEEALETVRYMSAESEGKEHAVRMAESSTAWANSVLRNEDFEAWFFRLLLEYGRIVDDDRETIGFAT